MSRLCHAPPRRRARRSHAGGLEEGPGDQQAIGISPTNHPVTHPSTHTQSLRHPVTQISIS
eukprot:1178306-Prorocentrum_minimum.AAC.1